jgi:REP element-mobilizing transposase RayT
MANTYSQIHIQTVFAVQDRLSLLNKRWREDLYRVITAIIQNNGHKMLAIGGIEDHVHLFFGLRPNESISHLVQEVKRDSALWINRNHLVCGRFSWQEGFGAFSYSRNMIPMVCGYIGNQEAHHKKKGFQEEYLELLEEFGIEYDKRYVFHSI